MAIPLIILLISNRKPKEKKVKKEKEEKEAEKKEKREPLFSKDRDNWAMHLSIIVGLILVLSVFYLVATIVLSFLLLSLFFGGGLIVSLSLLLGLVTIVGILVLMLSFFLIKRSVNRRIGEVDNLKFLSEFLIILVLLGLLSFIPYLGAILVLALFIFSIIWLLKDGQYRRNL